MVFFTTEFMLRDELINRVISQELDYDQPLEIGGWLRRELNYETLVAYGEDYTRESSNIGSRRLLAIRRLV